MPPPKPVKPIAGIPVLAGLLCVHESCGVLFSDLEESSSHADKCHKGTVRAKTCAIQELPNASGGIELLLVIYEAEEEEEEEVEVYNDARTELSSPASSMHNAIPTTIGSPTVLPTIESIPTPLSVETVPASTLVEKQTSSPVASQSSLASSLSSQPSSVPHSSVRISSNDSASPSTATARPPLMDPEATLERILRLAEELSGQCRLCWFRGETGKPHATYRCHSGVCSGNEWRLFKTQPNFPPGVICFMCFAPYGPPFNHETPSGPRYTGDLCDYPDVLKELTFIIYQDTDVRNTVFSRLGAPAPTTVSSYKRFIGRRRTGGLLGLYEVMATYLDIRGIRGPD